MLDNFNWPGKLPFLFGGSKLQYIDIENSFSRRTVHNSIFKGRVKFSSRISTILKVVLIKWIFLFVCYVFLFW